MGVSTPAVAKWKNNGVSLSYVVGKKSNRVQAARSGASP
jgi:hypothetical protein